MKLITDQPDEFLPRGEFLECAAEVGSRCYRVLFLNAPHHHTHVLCFDHHHDTQRVQRLLDAVLDLHSQAFLDLQAAGKDIHYPGNLAQTRNIFLGNISDMGLSEERKHMMFTQRKEINIFYNNHLLVVLFLKHSRSKHLCRVFVVSFG